MVSSDEEAEKFIYERKPRTHLTKNEISGIINPHQSSSYHNKNSAAAKKPPHKPPLIISQQQPPSLLDSSLNCFLQDTSISLFEIQVVQRCPKTLYPKLLACCLLQAKPRNFVIRVLLRHWPVETLNIEDLRICYPEFALLFKDEPIDFLENGSNNSNQSSKIFNKILDGTEIELRRFENEIFLDRVLLLLLENFISSVGFANHRMRLKCLDFRLLPWSESQHEILVKFLKRHEDLIADWCTMEPRSHLKVCMDLSTNDDSAIQFWTKFMKVCPTFVRTHSVILLSPLVSGQADTIRTVMKQLDKTTLKSLTIIGELLHNQSGLYETDVDHMRDTFNGLYKQEFPQWMPKLKNFTNLVSLDISNPAEELHPSAIGDPNYQANHVKRPSDCALNNWIQIFPLLSTHLRHLSLRGQFIQGHLEYFIGKNTTFCLESLNVEDCGLTASDMTFMGRSRHRSTMKVLKAGDINLGKKYNGIVNMLKGMKQLEVLDLCLENYELYPINNTLDDSQTMELIYLIRQLFTRSLKFLNLSGGHIWSKTVLLKALKHFVPLPNLLGLSLPVEGLSTESVIAFKQFRMADPGFKYKLEKCGHEFKELHKATLHYLRKGCQVTTSLCRDGLLLQFHVIECGREQFLKQKAEMKKFEYEMTKEFQKREMEHKMEEHARQKKSLRELNMKKYKEDLDRLKSSLMTKSLTKDVDDLAKSRAQVPDKKDKEMHELVQTNMEVQQQKKTDDIDQLIAMTHNIGDIRSAARSLHEKKLDELTAKLERRQKVLKDNNLLSKLEIQSKMGTGGLFDEDPLTSMTDLGISKPFADDIMNLDGSFSGLNGTMSSLTQSNPLLGFNMGVSAYSQPPYMNEMPLSKPQSTLLGGINQHLIARDDPMMTFNRNDPLANLAQNNPMKGFAPSSSRLDSSLYSQNSSQLDTNRMVKDIELLQKTQALSQLEKSRLLRDPTFSSSLSTSEVPRQKPSSIDKQLEALGIGGVKSGPQRSAPIPISNLKGSHFPSNYPELERLGLPSQYGGKMGTAREEVQQYHSLPPNMGSGTGVSDLHVRSKATADDKMKSLIANFENVGSTTENPLLGMSTKPLGRLGYPLESQSLLSNNHNTYFCN